MEKTYLLTGGTGFLGTLLASKLIKDGHKIIFLGRTKNGIDIYDRIKDSLWNYDNTIDINSLEVLEMNMSDENLGFSEKIIDKLKNRKIDGFWHLAANLSFKQKNKNEVFNTNTYELKNILNFVEKINTTFIFTSTAFVHGTKKGIVFENTNSKPSKFNNPYEESKFEAERIIEKWGKNKKENKYIIFRPSLLVEEEKTIFSLSGYYVVVASLHKLVKSFRIIKEKNPLLAKLLKIKINKNGKISSWIPFIYYNKGYLNLVPINIAINWMINIVENTNSRNKIYHIINTNPFKMSEIVEQTFEALNFKLPTYSTNLFFLNLYLILVKITSFFISNLKGFSRKLYYYKFYMTDNRIYKTDNTKQIIDFDIINNSFNLSKNFIKKTAETFIDKLN